jgi:hypothetical protein
VEDLLDSLDIESHEELNRGGLLREGWNMENEWTRAALCTDMI